ncbi:MAG TPA: FxsA family protein [Frankiaceae bacterium]|jgi:UPF0716 protein FxsA|nr:FxsA family protein [Frankiaceae bacterium]
MGLVILLMFLVVPFAELWVILRVAHVIGGWETVGLLVLMSVLGTWLLKREGARAWGAFQLAMREGRVPAKETADGALVILGGALLLTPGFLTDVVGVLCLLPPTRVVVRRGLLRFALRHNPVYATYDTARTVAGTAQRVQKVRSRRAPASDRRPANEPPQGPPPPVE